MRSFQDIAGQKAGKILEFLLLLWFFTLPFGAKIGSVSLGFVSVYPNFIVGLVLFPLVILSFPQWHRWAKLYFAFLGLWWLYSAIQPTLLGTGFNENWKFDFKSLAMQLLFSGILLGAFYSLQKERFYHLIKLGVLYFLTILIAFAIFEFYSGTHLRGQFTDNYFLEQSVTNLFYTPLFVYDNANDFLVYLILLTITYLALGYRGTRDDWKAMALLLFGFLFATIASSRLAIIVLIGLFMLIGAKRAYAYVRAKGRVEYVAIACGIALFGILLATNPLFIGPKYTKSNFTTDGVRIALPKSLPHEGLSSNEIRKGLLFNSIDFIKESPILGIGAGQFRERHTLGNVQHDTGTVTGAHNYPMELVTQYGIIGWLYFLVLAVLFGSLWSKFRKGWVNIWTLLLLPVLLVCSLMPSGFLYLDIHWLVIPLVLLVTLSAEPPKQEVHE